MKKHRHQMFSQQIDCWTGFLKQVCTCFATRYYDEFKQEWSEWDYPL